MSDIKKVSINHKQFLTSMVNTVKRRLLVGSTSEQDDTCSRSISPTILSDSYVLEVDYWPFDSPLDFGRKEIKSLRKRFVLPHFATMSAFGDFQDNGGRRVPTDLKPLINCTKVFRCSSSECKRGFSAMNLIISDERTRLLINRVSNLLLIKLHGPPLRKLNQKRM